MKTFKKNPKKQLEKFSTIFTQLGLVLTLFIVFISLEHKTEKQKDKIAVTGTEIITDCTFDQPLIRVKKYPVIKKEKPLKRAKKTDLTKINKVKDFDEAKSKVIDLPTQDTNLNDFNIDNVVEVTEDNINKEDDPTPVSINNVQNIPVYKGCEGLNEEETRVCFEKKIQRHVQRYFNAEIAQDAGLRAGMYKIYTQFIIDKNGNVNEIKIRAPHKRLEKEANKVITKIPQFTPGKQNNKPVNVRYTLPIAFKVD